MGRETKTRLFLGAFFAAGWLVLSYWMRHPIAATIRFVFAPDPTVNGSHPSASDYGFFLVRLILFLLTGVLGLGITIMLETCSPSSLIPDRYRKLARARTDPHPELARRLFAFVVLLALLPARWLAGPVLGGLTLYLIAVTLLGIQFIAAIGMGEAIGPIVKMDHSKRPPVLYVLGAIVFSFFAAFMSLHLPSYGLNVFRKTIAFGDARRHLLMLHALVMWCALPMYMLGTHDRRIILNFVKLNLWFLPWPKELQTSEEIGGGGLFGGAGASDSF